MTADITLAGTAEELRKALIQFGSGVGCKAADDTWGPVCGQPATWHVRCEDAHAGVSVDGVFTPATTQTVLCAGHMARLKREPRRIYGFSERLDPDAPSANLAVIQLPDSWNDLVGEEEAVPS